MDCSGFTTQNLRPQAAPRAGGRGRAGAARWAGGGRRVPARWAGGRAVPAGGLLMHRCVAVLLTQCIPHSSQPRPWPFTIWSDTGVSLRKQSRSVSRRRSAAAAGQRGDSCGQVFLAPDSDALRRHVGAVAQDKLLFFSLRRAWLARRRDHEPLRVALVGEPMRRSAWSPGPAGPPEDRGLA